MTDAKLIVKNKFDKLFSKDTAFRLATSPTLVWFVSLYFATLLMMIGFNIARLGFNADGILGGPQYYSRLFLTYGLNATSDYASPWFGGWAWVFAPFMIIFLGMPLYFLQDAGYSYNGIRQDPQGVTFYAFFKEDVYGYDVNIFGLESSDYEIGLFGLKANLFFIGLIWIPIIIASVNTVMVKRKYGTNITLPKRFIISFIIAVIIGIQMAKMTDPDLYFDWSRDGIWYSLFENRRVNRFVRYDGFYPPMMLATLMTLLQIVPMIVTGLVDGSVSWYQMTKKRREFLKTLLRDDLEEEDLEALPWEKDYLELKESILKKKKEKK